MRKKIIGIFLVMNIALLSLYGCSDKNPGKESDTQSVEKEIVLGEESNFYKIGDLIENKNVNQENNSVEIESCYTIRSATIYDTASEIEGIEDKIVDTEICAGGNPQKPDVIEKNEILNKKFLCCDIEIKNVNDSLCNISKIGLAYKENGVCNFLSEPSYFSKSKNMLQGVYEYNLLPGQTMTAQIGWCVDENLLQIENFDKKNLCLAIDYYGDEDVRKFVDLGLE